MGLRYVEGRRISLKDHPEFNESWVQERIVENPALLGLGDLDVKDIERRQPHAGRLDLLLQDPETNQRFEVELQLGPSDESHIIRTIEYWDIERRRYPQYDHVGVLVAEDITSRFLNVVSLFNGFIPLVAIQLSAVAVEDYVTLLATTVMDQMVLGLDSEDDEGEPVDRDYWLGRASEQTVEMVDQILDLVHEIDPSYALKYNKYSIGLAKNGVANNFLAFQPRKKHLIGIFRIDRDEALVAELEDAGFELLAYDARWGKLRVRIHPDDLDTSGEIVANLVKRAYANST